MSLSDLDIERYARHIVLAEIGAAGQEKLLASFVRLQGNADGVGVLKRYLEASGLRTTTDPEAPVDCVVVADGDPEAPGRGHRSTLEAVPVVWYRLDGATLRAGVSAGGRWQNGIEPEPTGAQSAAGDYLRHAIAACDAAARAIGVLLDWPPPRESFSEVRLA